MKGGKILYEKNRNIIHDTMTRTKGAIDPAFKEKQTLLLTSKVDIFFLLNKSRQ